MNSYGQYLLFRDFKQAYDTNTREKLYEALMELKYKKKIDVIKMTLETKNQNLIEWRISNQLWT